MTTTTTPASPDTDDALDHASGPRLDWMRAAPDALRAQYAFEQYVRGTGLDPALVELVRLRASYVNGCAYCVDMHTKDMRKAGETDQRIAAVPVWRETPFFTPAERAVLAWTEAVTSLGAHGVPEPVWAAARRHFDDRALVQLTMAVIAINGWNRLAITFGAEVGSYVPA